MADAFDDMVTRAVDAYKAPRLHVNDTMHDRRIDMEAALRAALGGLPSEPLYVQVWAILEEHIVNAKPIDLNAAEGQARMQMVCALLTTAIHNPHDLELDIE